jgi:hypothetical protein
VGLYDDDGLVVMNCSVCAAKCNNGFLCSRCQQDLKQLLDGLSIGNPLGNGRRSRPWLVSLADEALGDTRKGESARRASDRTQPMPFNENASTVALATKGMLGTWMRHLCETRGAQCPATTDSVDIALWLSRNISAIAADEACGDLFSEIKEVTVVIERVINRPVAPVPLGPCPTLVAHHQECAIRLSAPPAAVEVTCQGCGATYATEDLFERTLEATAYRLMTSRELGVALAALGTPVPLRLLRDWRYQGRLKPTTFAGEEALYRFGEARKLAEEAAAKSRKTA